jgi:peptide/nickel transport system ATP-binding protein
VPSPDILSIENLRVEYLSDYGRACVVDDVSFTIRAGDVFGLAGESGSGKSTVAQAVLRVLRPPAVITNGRVMLNGRDVLDMDAKTLKKVRWREVAMVTQSAMNALNPVASIEAQIADVLEAHEGMTGDKARARILELLELVGIDGNRMRSYPHELSGGMRQRVVIAMALALSPKMLIMDEPTTALDVIVEREILGQISALRKKFGFSVLFISHDLSLMREFCTHLGVLRRGKLVESGPSESVFTNPQHEYTRHLLDSLPTLHKAGTKREAPSTRSGNGNGNGNGSGAHARAGTDGASDSTPPAASESRARYPELP